MWLSAKHHAEKANREFTITVEDIVIPERCPYLDIPLIKKELGPRADGQASIDRKDSNKGYTKDNIQIISWLANRMKSNATEEQLLKFAKGILKWHSEDTNI